MRTEREMYVCTSGYEGRGIWATYDSVYMHLSIPVCHTWKYVKMDMHADVCMYVYVLSMSVRTYVYVHVCMYLPASMYLCIFM